MVNKKFSNSLIKLTERLCSVISNSIPAYSCRKSKRVYKQYQLAVIWCLMKYLKTNYRRIMEIIDIMPEVRRIIGMNQLPHFTTINKFFLRTGTSNIRSMLLQTTGMILPVPDIAAVDATGYSSSHASRHYLWRIGLGDYTKRKYVKLSISVCTDTQCILAVKARLGPRNDNIDFPGLARDSSKMNPEYIVADKGYDSEKNHHIARRFGMKPVIPLRNNRYGTVRKYQRRKMLKEFDDIVYHMRSIVETVNSVMKRLMGSWLNSRSLVSQKKELIWMCVVYNVHRLVKISLFYWMFSTEPNLVVFSNN